MNLPAFPKSLASLIAALPAWPPSQVFTRVGNRLVWPTLNDLDWSNAQGRRFCVKVKDLGLAFYFSVGASGFQAEREPRADVTFTATAQDYARLALRLEDPDTLFFNRRLLIEGDTDLGLTVKNLLDGVEWETVTSRLPLGLGRLAGLARERALRHAA
jgi:predicted lipid carrier protein YhbT